jgi:sigma-E factor negative regulatory protein RseC
VEAVNAVGAKVGDKVIISTATSSYLKMTFLLYMVPVLALLIGAAVGIVLAPLTGWDESLAAALAGLVALVPVILFVKYQANRMAVRSAYRPKISRILHERP